VYQPLSSAEAAAQLNQRPCPGCCPTRYCQMTDCAWVACGGDPIAATCCARCRRRKLLHPVPLVSTLRSVPIAVGVILVVLHQLHLTFGFSPLF
jgi:hypothetical protein